MSLTLEYNGSAQVPLEVEGILPETVRDLSLEAIARLPVYHGNEQTELGYFFRISGEASDMHMVWNGPLQGVHWLGAKMTAGTIRVEGNIGRHLGSEMQGGSIEVQGNASDWVGGEMKGGRIHVRGDAGHLVGAAYRGSARGMTGGAILVEGRAGNETGHTMRRGLVAVGGDIGDLVGFNMRAGTVLCFAKCGIRPGAGMRRGTLAFFGDRPELLPTFRFGCRNRLEILVLLLRQLSGWGWTVPESLYQMQLDLYHGDLIEGGRGEVLMRA